MARDRRIDGHPPVGRRRDRRQRVVRWLRGLGVDGPIRATPNDTRHSDRFGDWPGSLARARADLRGGARLNRATRKFEFREDRLNRLVDGGLSNPVPVSVCRALGADVIIAVNLNGDLLGRRFVSEPPSDATLPPQVPKEFLAGVLKQHPRAGRASHSDRPAASATTALIPRLLPGPSELDQIMQDDVTRARLAGEPPHVMAGSATA